MAGNNGGRAQSSTPTIREQLAARTKISPTIRSQSGYSYDEARPSYVERSYNAGGQYEVLARSLAGFDKSLSAVLEHRLDRKIEEGVAAGQVLFAENAGENKNQQNWKVFTEENPQYAGDNPWLERGYEQARLRGLGLDLEKSLVDAFEQSGMKNETDPKKVSAFVEEQVKTFRDAQGLSGYADKLFLAQNYTVTEAKVKQGIYAQHSQYLKAQQEERTVQQYTDLTLKSMEAAIDPLRGGGNPNDPFQRDAIMQNFSATVAANVQEATKNGVRNIRGPEMAANMFLTAYSKTKNPAYLKAMELFEINGTALINHTGVSEKIEMLERRQIEQQRSDVRHGWAVQEHNDKMMEKQLAGLAYQYAQTGQPVTADVLVQLKIPDRFAGEFTNKVGAMYEGLQKTVQLSPTTRQEAGLELLRAKRGELTQTDAVNAIKHLGPLGKEIFEAYEGSNTEQGKLLAGSLKSGGDKLFSMLSRSKDKLDFSLLSLEEAENLTQEQRDGLHAIEIFQAGYEEAFKKLAGENKGSVSPAQAERLKTEHIQKTIDIMGKQTASQAAPTVAPAQEKAPVTKGPVAFEDSIPQAGSISPSTAAANADLIAWIETKEAGASKQLGSLSEEAIIAWLKNTNPAWVEEYTRYKGGGR